MLLVYCSNPSFDPAAHYAVRGVELFSVVVGDFNGDGDTDLAVGNDGSNNVSVLLGTGTDSPSCEGGDDDDD